MLKWIRTRIALKKADTPDDIHAILDYDPVLQKASIELREKLKELADYTESGFLYVPQEWRHEIERLWETNSDKNGLAIFGKRIVFVANE